MLFPRRRLASVLTLATAAVLTPPARSFSGGGFLQSLVRDLAGVQVAPPERIAAALRHPGATEFGVPDRRWINAAAPQLEADSRTLLPHKEAPVVVYCASGMRSARCKDLLERQGYSTVLNAGGLADLDETLLLTKQEQ